MITITVGPEFFWAAIGAAIGAVVLLGFLVLLVAFGHWHIRLRWLTPSWAAGARRFFKLLAFPILGVLLSNAAAWSVALLVHFHVDQSLATPAGVLIGAAVGGLHQKYTWIDNPAQVTGSTPGPTPSIDPGLTGAPVL